MIDNKPMIKAIKYMYDYNELSMTDIAKLLDLKYDDVFHILVCEEVEYND